MLIFTFSGLYPSPFTAARNIVNPDWLGAQNSIVSPSTRAVQLIGSMHACVTLTEVYSATSRFAALAIAPFASPCVSYTMPVSARLRARWVYSASTFSVVYSRARERFVHATFKAFLAFSAAG